MQNNNLLPYNGTVHYYENVINSETAYWYRDALLDKVIWKPDEIVMFGKKITTKRKVAWYAESDLSYTYAGSKKNPIPFIPELLELKQITETICNCTFNSCLLNLYSTGLEGMGWHSDNEKEMGSTIASLSLGAERKFAFKHRQNSIKEEVFLANGSLLVMKNETQQYWLHSLPVSKKVNAIRINLTFRNIIRAV